MNWGMKWGISWIPTVWKSGLTPAELKQRRIGDWTLCEWWHSVELEPEERVLWDLPEVMADSWKQLVDALTAGDQQW